MRSVTFPVVSLGSKMPELPEADALGSWIKSRYGKESDIFSWAVEETIKDQKENVSVTCAGGEFYKKRIEESLADDFSFDMKTVSDDIETVSRYFKNCRFSLPAPSSFSSEKDSDETTEDLTKAFSKFYREMRDLGISGHVLLSEKPNEIELDEFSSGRFLWVTPSTELENILERARDIVIESDDISHLENLFDSYNIRYVYIKDADTVSLKKTLEMFDAEYIFVCGTAPENERADYWKKLSEVSVDTSV